MGNMLEIIMRLKNVKNLDARHSTLVENAYYQCKPPERSARVSKVRPPLHQVDKPLPSLMSFACSVYTFYLFIPLALVLNANVYKNFDTHIHIMLCSTSGSCCLQILIKQQLSEFFGN